MDVSVTSQTKRQLVLHLLLHLLKIVTKGPCDTVSLRRFIVDRFTCLIRKCCCVHWFGGFIWHLLKTEFIAY
jgi:hypothetical protein